MRILTIKEPFASLICQGIKRIETRSWKTNYRGIIYVHAGLTKVDLTDERIKKLVKLLPNQSFNYGSIICKCNLKDCIYMDNNFINEIKRNSTEYTCGHYEVGRYGWELELLEVLVTPIKVRGKLGIWKYNE